VNKDDLEKANNIATNIKNLKKFLEEKGNKGVYILSDNGGCGITHNYIGLDCSDIAEIAKAKLKLLELELKLL
jgi:hypothetical protein